MGAIPAPSIFGIDTETEDTNHGYYVRDIPAARQLGARFTHITLGAGTGTGNFAAPDYEVTQARNTAWGSCSASAAWPAPARGRARTPTRARRAAGTLGKYEAYVRRMLLRYRNVVQYYESWTEPNNSSSWAGGPNPAMYAALLKADYATVQSVNSQYHKQLKLLFGSPIGFQVNNNPNWTAVLPFADAVLADLGGANPFDGVALHAYRLPRDVKSEAVGPTGEVCDYVGGVPVTPGYNSSNCPARQLALAHLARRADRLRPGVRRPRLRPAAAVADRVRLERRRPGKRRLLSNDVQARYLSDAYSALLQLPFVQAAMWFTIRDYQPGLVTGDPAYFYHYGLLNYAFSQKPAASNFTSMAAANPGK